MSQLIKTTSFFKACNLVPILFILFENRLEPEIKKVIFPVSRVLSTYALLLCKIKNSICFFNFFFESFLIFCVFFCSYIFFLLNLSE